MIKNLKNPKTSLYLEFKKYIFSSEFCWYYNSYSTHDGENPEPKKYINIPFYSHNFLQRPEYNGKYPLPNSDKLEMISSVFKEIITHNDINFTTFLRINANCTHPQLNTDIQCTVPHYDHTFPHKNMLIYFSDAGGKTVVDDKIFEPKEDDVIIFEGKHYYYAPLEKRRIICVATFI
jgi:hypothetical protein